jgi:hypothetical protein
MFSQPIDMPLLIQSSLAVLKRFVIPVGGGIPSGVLLAKSKGLAWPLTALLYLVSDILLAVAFEPILRALAAIAARIPFLARFNAAMKVAMARSVTPVAGTATGPLGLVLVAFGVDPMTGRASAMAAGHGFISGWAIAITGDMLYFTVLAVSTLQLSSYFKDPNTVVLIVLAAMFLLPMLVRTVRSRWLPQREC